ncbi:MAG: bifunctional riboflavin kinase/FAD synthetase [Candidatus Aminicenantes bacterium]
MKIIEGFETLPPASRQTAVAIGNFDGIHIGHKKILEFLSHKARQSGFISVVLTFSPHPEKILGKKRVKMIQTMEQRLEEIEKYGIQIAFVIPFDKKFSALSGQDFIQKILIDSLQAKVVVVGEDFHFGRNRGGDISLLQHISSAFGLKVFSLPSVTKDGMVVSSSLIRNLLQKGETRKANALLGRNYRIDGKLIKEKSGRQILGFKPANIRSENEIVPPGVFITKVVHGSKVFPSLISTPHFPASNQKEIKIEAYIQNFHQNLYQKKIRIYFMKKIREKIKYGSSEDISQQIRKNIDKAKKYFATAHPEN